MSALFPAVDVPHFRKELHALNVHRMTAIAEARVAEEQKTKACAAMTLHALKTFSRLFTVAASPDCLLMPLHRTMWPRACFQQLEQAHPSHPRHWLEPVDIKPSLGLAYDRLGTLYRQLDCSPDALADCVCEAGGLHGFLLLRQTDALWEALSYNDTPETLPLMVTGYRTFVRSFRQRDTHSLSWGVLRPGFQDDWRNHTRNDQGWFFGTREAAVAFALELETGPVPPSERPFEMPAGLSISTLFASV